MPLCPKCLNRRDSRKVHMIIKKRKICKGFKTVMRRKLIGKDRWQYFPKEVKYYSGVVRLVWWCPKCKYSM